MSTTTSNMLFEKHQDILSRAQEALFSRGFYSDYPEHPKAYGEGKDEAGKDYFGRVLNQDFKELSQDDSGQYIGEEVSPFLQVGLGTKYPTYTKEVLLERASNTIKVWGQASPETRAGILIESLERLKERFFDIAYATMHTTGQSYMMSFQASGPHANDRALEAVAMGYVELTRFPETKDWVKPMGKFDLQLKKNWKALPKGVGLVIGCSTFPIWNTVPGVYANLITGNPTIIKPHPKAVLPIAIVVAELQKVLQENGFDPHIVQLAVDGSESPITKDLAEDERIKLIDYTGNTPFGNYIETLPKTVFTEKAGVNSVILDSTNDLKATLQNITFAASLYSGQMCTAPQNVFIPSGGVHTPEGVVSYEDVVKHMGNALTGLVTHPKAGAATLGGVQNDATLKRVKEASENNPATVPSQTIANPEFEHARTASPAIIELDASDEQVFGQECFGPTVFVVKTANTEESIALASKIASIQGSITCSAYCTDEATIQAIEEGMNAAYTPVSFNFSGAAFVNQHAAFSDFHVTGGNPSGNASFVNPEYLVRRFVWVGNRYM